MCGLCGFIDYRKKSNDLILRNMNEILHHRGPNDEGKSFYENESFQLGLAHKRLSILDLSKHGHQPMQFDYLEIIYNGEVYNFKEIREKLEKYDYTFESDSDTEVILKAYHKWGVDFVQKLIGMFSIVIYDKNKMKIFMIRDRAGVKPFYYYEKNDLFLFSSELKAFHEHPNFQKEIDYNGLASFFRYGYITAPYTIFMHTYKLEAGHYIEYDLYLNKKILHKYWDVYEFYNKPKLNINENEALEKIEELLQSSFTYRMVSDVPVGVFLSGGYDSTAVTTLLQKNSNKKLKTFTIGFESKEFNEADLAKKYSEILGTEHYEYIATEQDAIDIISKLADIYDEPFGDSSAIPTILVSQIAKKEVSVVLSADGSDEIFGGYNKHHNTPNLYNKFQKLTPYSPLFNFVRPIFQNKILKKVNIITNYDNKVNKFYDMLNHNNMKDIFHRTNYYFTDNEIKNLIKTDFEINNAYNSMEQISSNSDFTSKIMAVDYKTYMADDILTKVDRATMSVGLEGREPFLDHRIIEFVAQLPISLKYKENTPKYLLKQIVHKYIPKEIIDKPKKGFSIPIKEWYDTKLKNYFMDYLNQKAIEEVGVLDYGFVKEILKRYENGETFLIKNIWYIFIFQQWAKKWLK
ncbi:asparagine synthase (glutamine-hydrolyzing) [Aliarcobacter lanthieri]|uniref:asparagine synthase (glutamine-hydrolyzing) n=1 Tax=Aliarcobacter lanthieri TaxID=1355374 RepID=UPI003AFAE081